MDEMLGVFFAMVVGMIYVPKIMHATDLARQEENDVATAQQLQQWASAVTNYAGQNLATLAASATATTPVTLSVATVQAANVGLPPNFSGKNLANQTWTAQVLQPTAGTLNVLVFGLGGNAIKDQELGVIARAAGGSGGFIPSNNTGAYPGGPASAYGTFGSWKLSTAGYSVGAGGSPATLVTFTNGALSSNYLYRNAVPGQPQLNEMNTSLGMNGNNITNVGQLQANSGNGVQVGNSYYYGDATDSAIRQNGTLYVQTPAGAPAPINTGAANINGDVNIGGTVNTWGNSAVSGAITAGGSLTTAGNSISYGYVVSNYMASPNSPCSPNGAMGNSGSGPLFCQSGVWKYPGSTNNYIYADFSNGQAFALQPNTKRVDGWVTVAWSASNAGVAEFVIRDTSGNIQNYYYAGDYGYNDGGSGSVWWFPVSIPTLANSASIQLVETNGSNSMTWHVFNYEN